MRPDYKYRGSVDHLEIPVRAANALWDMRVFTLMGTARLTEKMLLSQRNVGKRTVRDLKNALALYGLQLGMSERQLADWAERIVESYYLQKDLTGIPPHPLMRLP
jgi:DNA-directed RNA polymerase alpha subunit